MHSGASTESKFQRCTMETITTLLPESRVVGIRNVNHVGPYRLTASFKFSSKSVKKVAFSDCSSANRRPLTVTYSSSAESVQSTEIPLNSEVGVSYELLREKLATGLWEEADNETRRLLCVLAGEGAEKRKWVYFSEVQFIPVTDLVTIDSLWKSYSGNRFGFSVQRRLWLTEKRQWKPFFLRIGWTFGENSTYKKFPLDFTWDISAPEGHLPLTNALRGTQLFEKLLTHPAFEKSSESTQPGSQRSGSSSSGSKRPSTSDSKPRQLNILDEFFKY